MEAVAADSRSPAGRTGVEEMSRSDRLRSAVSVRAGHAAPSHGGGSYDIDITI
jgi:hypothetical protein